MAKLTHIQTNFTAGEITPRMKGRPDVARYSNGAERVENCTISVHGGVDRRHGLRFAAAAKLAGQRKVDLVRYRFNVDQAYMLEFGHLYVRVFAANGAQLLDESLAPIEIASPYTEDQIFQVTRCQGGDTMFLFHPQVPTHRLRRTGLRWSMEPVPWITEPFGEIGHRPNAQLSLSATTVGAGRTFSTTATAPPAAPTMGVVTPFNGAVRVTFTPPASTGGGRISHYTVTASPGGLTATGTGSPMFVEGLTNGVAYTFTVTATNGAGTSAPSAASASVTPLASLPSAVITINVTPPSMFINVGNFEANVPGPTASASGASGAVTYTWEKLSGGPWIHLGAMSGPTPTINSIGSNTTNYITLRVVGVDAAGGRGEYVCDVAVQHESGRGPGGGLIP